MNCESFLALPEYKKAEYCAKLIHACTSDNALFKNGDDLIKLGERKGLFEGVKIGNDAFKEKINDDLAR